MAPALLLNFANLRMSSEAVNAQGQIGGADESATKFLLGGGIQGGVSYELTEWLGIGGTVGYEWIQKAEADCGSTEVEIDYSSLTVSVGIFVNF
jgi:opacity protein-like surface antigen